MTALQKKLLAVVTVLTLIVCTMAVCMWQAVDVQPDRLVTTTLALKSDKIPQDMKDVSIVYFTDLEFGEYENEQRTKKVFEQIRHLNPSILIFGGDLFQSGREPTDEEVQKMTEWLSSIEAPLGKFAVWGEQDLTSDERIAKISQIYANAQIEIIDNSNCFLGNRTSKGIRLVGLSPQADYDQALAGVDGSQFTLLVSHFTDPFAQDVLNNAPIDQAVGGNSHGTQITFPVYGGYRQWPGSTEVNRAEGVKTSFPYYISSGTGCIEVNARFNAVPEVVYMLLN